MSNPESIQSQGGKARAEKLTAEQKKEIASKAAAARWGPRLLYATHKGNFKEKFSIDVDCYVLNDPQKTAVISQIGMGRSLGLSARGSAFPRFIASKAMADSIGAELALKLSQPIKFQWGTGGAEEPPTTINGFDVTLLIEVCEAIVRAEPKLTPQQKHIATQAHIINAASAKSGIKGLVYALAGYSPTAVEVIEAFKAYVQEEAKKYEKEFPPELYTEWYRLYQIPPIQGRGRPWQFKKLTVEHVYYPLAKSRGMILQLIRAAKAQGGDRGDKLFQFLNEVGTKAFRLHMGRLVEMAQDSTTIAEYEAKILKRFGGEEQLNFLSALNS